MRKTLLIAFLAACFAAAGFAAEKNGTIGVSLLAMSNPFFKDIADNMAAEAARHGYEVVAVDGNFDVARQSNQVKDFIASQYDCIVLSPCDSKAIGSVIKEANDAGIPVFTVDIASMAENAKVIAHIATDNFAGGRVAADGMVAALGGKGKIGILGHPEVESGLMRANGFKAQLKDLGKEKDIVIVAELPALGSRERGFSACQDMMQAHPDIDGIFCINDPTVLGALAALEGIGKADRVKLIGFDGMPEAKQAIKDGKLYGSSVQFPDRLGIKVVQAFINYMNGEEVPGVELIGTELYTKADADKDSSLK
ncbi:MAG: substrate-binding domain-containing protein [Planctomycetota bacterium]|jgi:ribose transport system substrate-binding protein|nr:substrate-binding domain-containing protein [Planctomycetota bacterium]